MVIRELLVESTYLELILLQRELKSEWHHFKSIEHIRLLKLYKNNPKLLREIVEFYENSLSSSREHALTFIFRESGFSNG
jgi:hypothetical protein